MFKWRIDVLAALKDRGFSSYRIMQSGLINSTAMQKIRCGDMIAWEQLGRICGALNCQPGDLIEYIPDQSGE